MTLNKWKYFFICVYACILILVNFSFYFVDNNKYDNPYFVLAILGDGLKSESYFPEDNSTINLGVKLSWFIYVYNGMGVSQYIKIKVKFLSSSLDSPNTTLCLPCSGSTLYEIKTIIKNNETWIVPFVWIIESMDVTAEYINIKSIRINNDILEVNVNNDGDQEYKIVFELWVYDVSIGDFVFDLSGFSISRCLWNQLYFKINI